jgi:hypothetical protein
MRPGNDMRTKTNALAGREVRKGVARRARCGPANEARSANQPFILKPEQINRVASVGWAIGEIFLVR